MNSPVPQFDCVLFDWDGTLMDSCAVIIKNIQQAAVLSGHPPCAPQTIRPLIGLTLKIIITTLYPALSQAQIKIVSDAYYGAVAANEAQELFFAGALELLQALRARGIVSTIATGKSRLSLDRVFTYNRYWPLFALTKTGDETRSKPHPQMINETLSELGIAPNRAVMVGDTTYDLEMAARAGIAAVGVSYGMHSIAALQAYAPLAIIDHPLELLPLVC